MGKRDKRVAYMNPIAMARASGPPPTSGPTIKDYLGRPRPTLEEVQEIMAKRRKECSSLAQWEDKMHEEQRAALQRQRDSLMTSGESSKPKKSKKKKKNTEVCLAERRVLVDVIAAGDEEGDKRSKHDRKTRKKHRSKRASSSEGEETISDDDKAHVSKKDRKHSSKRKKHKVRSAE